MDIFIQNLDAIKSVAKKLALSYRGFQIDELVNAAYICFDKVITKHPELVESKFSRLTTLLFRVKCDMRDYIRKETHSRRKKYAEEKGNFFPTFLSFDFIPSKRDSYSGEEFEEFTFEPAVDSVELEQVDNLDLLKSLQEKVKLTDKEWAAIRGYFYDKKNFKEIGAEIGTLGPQVCKIVKCSLNKYKRVAKSMGEIIS